MSEYTKEYLEEFHRKQVERRKKYTEARKKVSVKLGVEVSRLAAHALRVLAEEKGLSMGQVLTKMLEYEAAKRGLELPPGPVSQLVTPKETPKVDLTKTLDVWEEE